MNQIALSFRSPLPIALHSFILKRPLLLTSMANKHSGSKNSFSSTVSTSSTTTFPLYKSETNSSFNENNKDYEAITSDCSFSSTSVSMNDEDLDLDLDLNFHQKESSIESLLDLKQISSDTFINKSELFVPYRGRGLFGGTMAAQSVLAALYYSNTIDQTWKPISIHCHFLKAAKPAPNLVYKVINLKGGKNYCTHEINLFQNDVLIFKAIVSLQAYKLQGSASNLDGQLVHNNVAPVIGKDIKRPDEMFDQTELFKIWHDKKKNKHDPNALAEVVKCYNREPCIWKLPLDLFDLTQVTQEEKNMLPSQRTLRYWCKSKDPLKNPMIFNWVTLAYVSDYFYLSANMRLNLHEMFTTKFSVSLDHTIYFNHEIDTSTFFNYNVKSLKSGENRSIMFGEIFGYDGQLAATTIQEGLSVIYTDQKRKGTECKY